MRHNDCPSCGVNLVGKPKPPTDPLDTYTGEPHNGFKWQRTISHTIPDVYQGALYWSCPDCGFAWQRWHDGWLGEASATYVRWHNADRRVVA